VNLAIVLSRLSNGGLERVQSSLVKEFTARGMRVAVAAGQVLHRRSGDFPGHVEIDEVAAWGIWSFPLGLYRFFKRTRPQCVFTTSNDVACIAIVLKRLFFPAVSVIVTQHQSLSGPIGYARGLKRLKLRLVRACMKGLLPKADGFVAVTRQVADDLAQQTGLDVTRIRVVHNPIVGDDLDEFAAAPSTVVPWPKNDAPVIVFAGRLSPEKRLDLLLDAFTQLRCSQEARLLILGDGPQRSWVEQRIRAQGLGDSCVAMGFVENVLPLIASSHVLVLPSDYEGFGNVLVEAMACGVQVIATSCPHGPAEILDNGRYGQLVPTGDVAALQEAMERSLSGVAYVPPDVLRSRAAQFGTGRAADLYLELAASCVMGISD
jgi:glycosyltransferase involved in cell wall biosynthesis